MKARGASIISVIQKNDNDMASLEDHSFTIHDDVEPEFSIMPYVVPLQLFSYYMALRKGYDPYKPRNLAKSVTDFANLIAGYFMEIWDFLIFIWNISAFVVVLVGAILWFTGVNDKRGKGLVLVEFFLRSSCSTLYSIHLRSRYSNWSAIVASVSTR